MNADRSAGRGFVMSPRDAAEDWLAACPERMRAPLTACAAGHLPVSIALLRLAIEAREAQEVEDALALALRCGATLPAAGTQRLQDALRTWQATPRAFATVKKVLRGVEHRGTAASVDEGIARWARQFDRMANLSPEASVALYTFGDPGLLRAATEEVVERLQDWRLLGRERTALDLGCGIGRFVEALAPAMREVTGIDISPVMIAHASRRCAHLLNVSVKVSSGQDLACFAPGSFDLILAADVFPYLVHTGPDLAAVHIREAHRVLKPDGSLLILNYSYRGNDDQDRAEVAALAAQYGLCVRRLGSRDLSQWDAAIFHLAKKG
jgi:SAM-dependent methyltransferase